MENLGHIQGSLWALLRLGASGVLLHLQTKAAPNVSDPVPAVTLSRTFLPLQQLKQRLHQSQQRATLCSQAAEEAQQSRGEAEKGRALAEARALGCQRDKEVAEADRSRAREEVTQLRKEV